MKPIILLSVAAASCLLPFLGKAFHIDDPMFLWPARQIHLHPFDPYGFSVNWYGTEQPCSFVMKNPPLTSYYIAAVAWLFGWSEIALHSGFLVPAIGAVLGTWRLGKALSPNPVTGAAFMLATPAFLVSSTNVMADTLMLCLFVWAVVIWNQGLERSHPLDLAVAAILIAAAVVTKYFAASLVPLLLTYTIAKERRISPKLAWLTMTIALVGAYELWTWRMYQQPLFTDAANFAVAAHHAETLCSRTVIALCFTGGSFATILFVAPFVYSRKSLAIAALFAAAVAVVVKENPWHADFSGINYFRDFTWLTAAQIGLMASAGLLILWLAARNLLVGFHPPDWLFSLWIVGTFVFVAFVNWTCSVRHVLPMAPAIGILVARNLRPTRPARAGASLAFIPAAALSLAVAYADFQSAGSARAVARIIGADESGKSIWFEGHWGFQYYMKRSGFHEIDYRQPQCAPGDAIVIPSQNTGLRALAPQYAALERVIAPPECSWMSVMTAEGGAGFYSSVYGPFPFVFQLAPIDRYMVFRIRWPEGG